MFASIFNTYITDTENEFRKNHIALKRNFYNSEVLAERTAAPTQGVRAGQNSLPRKVTPKGSTSTQFPRCPLSILPATHKRTADPRWFFCPTPILQTWPGRLLGTSQPLGGQQGSAQPLASHLRHRTWFKRLRIHCTRLCRKPLLQLVF